MKEVQKYPVRPLMYDLKFKTASDCWCTLCLLHVMPVSYPPSRTLWSAPNWRSIKSDRFSFKFHPVNCRILNSGGGCLAFLELLLGGELDVNAGVVPMLLSLSCCGEAFRAIWEWFLELFPLRVLFTAMTFEDEWRWWVVDRMGGGWWVLGENSCYPQK